MGVHRRDRERGQALVEFALILPVFMVIVIGVIQFGIALNFWLDMQRIANQGARWAAVNAYPECPRTGPDAPCSPTLQEYLANERAAQGEDLDVRICFPSGASTFGNPVKVTVTQPLSFFAIVNIPGIRLEGTATMRLEQTAGRYEKDDDPPC